jgi:hypothetical protein
MKVIMCKRCCHGIEYDNDKEPDTHSDVGQECPRPYLE